MRSLARCRIVENFVILAWKEKEEAVQTQHLRVKG